MQKPVAAKHANSSVLVGIRHPGLAEGVRDLLASSFDSVTTGADERSLVEGAVRLNADLVVVDLDFGAGDGLGLVRRLRESLPSLSLIVLSMDDSRTVERIVLEAGADRLMHKSAIACELIRAAEALLGEPHPDSERAE